MRFLLPILLLVLGVLGVDVPVFLDGALIDATADDDSYNTGGTISVNGWNVTVPKNMLVTFPAAFVPWKDFVADKAAVLGFEVNVAGNIVNGVPLAAQIIISEFAMEMNQGHIESINFDGSIKIVNGPIIHINDPNAVFTAGYSYPFMVVDDKSPSISAFSGFPMCVPRSSNDTLCPMSNRPTLPGSGAYRRVFQAPDPLVMAPFVVGDFIVYRGFRLPNNEMVVYEIVTWNVQVTTVGSPTYLRVEEVLIGIYTPDTNGEVAETRFIGYVSDPSVTISILALDIDPCTGHETERSISVGQHRPEAGGRNKWLARIDGRTTPSIYTREYKFITSSGTVLTKNNITAGQYISPILEWIQPELLVPGAEPLIHEYSALSHLTKGVGPDANGNIFGPLDPFPQTGVTVFDVSTCGSTGPGNPDPEPGTGVTPTARVEAGLGTVTVTNQRMFVRSDDTFVLRGFHTNANDPAFAGDNITYTWSIDESQSEGTVANLFTFTPVNNGQNINVRFRGTAPVGDYVFQLSVTSASQNTTGTATFTINFFTGPDTIEVTAVTWTSSQSGTIGVTCKSNYLVDSKVQMRVTYPGDGGQTTSAMTATPANSGNWSFSTRRVARPGTVSCQSNLGGFGSRTGTTSKRDLAAVEWTA
ncbi:hypothetical protein OQA88_11661 [Cercophora sp. LCS_1]